MYSRRVDMDGGRMETQALPDGRVRFWIVARDGEIPLDVELTVETARRMANVLILAAGMAETQGLFDL